MYSISLCLGKIDHLYIDGPILLPYLELFENSTSEEDIKNQEKRFK